MADLIVQKYGGMCLATPEKVRQVANLVAERHRQGKSLIIIVSAMGKTTDELIRLAYNVSPSPNRRELDMLLSTGERVSMALVTMALRDQGCEAISFTGSQAGIMTDASHASAKIIDVRPTRIEEALARKQVVVLAGFQGVNPTNKEITTLGRGGSDTTAVAMAARFQGSRCEIIKEVDGICSADPKLVTNVKVYAKLDYGSLAEMCFWGAKVLHYRSVELARSMRVPLDIKFLKSSDQGTTISDEVNMYENQKILAVNSHHDVHHIEISTGSMDEAMARLSSLLKESQLGWPQILASAFDEGKCRLMITSDPEHLASLTRLTEKNPMVLKTHRQPMSSVTLTCYGSVNSDLPSLIIHRLAEAGIPTEKLLLSPQSVTVVLAPEKRAAAIEVLHQLIK